TSVIPLSTLVLRRDARMSRSQDAQERLGAGWEEGGYMPSMAQRLNLGQSQPGLPWPGVQRREYPLGVFATTPLHPLPQGQREITALICRALHNPPQYIRENAAVQVIVDLDRGIDAQQQRHVLAAAIRATDHQGHVL